MILFYGLFQSLNSFADNFKNSIFSGTTLSLPYKYKTDNNSSFFTKGKIVFPDMSEEILL
ncbi:MAG: hypothetical protein ACM3ZS_03335 [Nitrososphaerota archaeon]|jgi:hypothetical protein|nr:hypothetical protein [Nitrososphaeraceae archaeon]